MFQKEFRLKTLGEWDYKKFCELLGEKTDYTYVFGHKHSGSSTVASRVSSSFNQHVISYHALEDIVKKRLVAAAGEDGEAPESVPSADVLRELEHFIENGKKDGVRKIYVVEGFPTGNEHDLANLTNIMGLPDNVIQTQCDMEVIKKRFKAAKEIEEIGEEHAEELAKEAEKYNGSVGAWQALVERHQGRVGYHQIPTDVSQATTNKALDEIFSAKVILVNHEKRLATDTTCCNLAIKYNLVYISAYQLLRHHIENDTPYGKRLAASKKPKHIKIQTSQQKDEFKENDYSAAHFDFNLVLDVVKDKINQMRTNQKFIVIEGICNSSKLVQEDDKMEHRHMDELWHIERELGEVVGVASL
jgi:hypothetical protein